MFSIGKKYVPELSSLIIVILLWFVSPSDWDCILVIVLIRARAVHRGRTAHLAGPAKKVLLRTGRKN